MPAGSLTGQARRPLLRYRCAVALFLVLLGVFYLATLRSGQPWGDDFAMYILQARNIASGQWSAPTGFIYDPVTGPVSYPPMLPLMLAPLVRIWGLNLTPMKVEVVLLFLAGLYLVFEFTSRQVSLPYAAGIVAVMGLSPYFWEIKENVISDLPFLFFTFLALCVISACDRNGWRSTAGACAAAACVYLCFATRTAGIVLIPCLLLSALPRLVSVESRVKSRLESRVASRGESRMEKPLKSPMEGRFDLRPKAAFAMVAAVGLIGIHSFFFRGAGSYLNSLGSPWLLPRNLMGYSWNLRQVFLGIGGVFGWLFLLVLVALGCAGFVIRLRSGVSLAEVFTLTCGLLVLSWTIDEDLRFLIPILPMWFLYIAVALERLPPRSGLIAGGTLLAVIIAGYTLRYSRIDTGPIREGMGDPDFRRTAGYIRSQTPPGSVFVFAKPRLLALLTGHPTSAYHKPASDGELWSYFRHISARYILVNREFASDREYLEPLLMRNSGAARQTFFEGAFHLYVLE